MRASLDFPNILWARDYRMAGITVSPKRPFYYLKMRRNTLRPAKNASLRVLRKNKSAMKFAVEIGRCRVYFLLTVQDIIHTEQTSAPEMKHGF